jgi:hypothetical protein
MLPPIMTSFLKSMSGNPDFSRARASIEHTLPAKSDKLRSDSWGYVGEVTDPHDGRDVTIGALTVLREDVVSLEAAINTPPEGFEPQEDHTGGTVWRFPEGGDGRRLADAAERLSDFDLLDEIDLELVGYTAS